MNVDIDYFIQVTFVLLILSMITEKFSNWIKLALPDNAFKRTVVRDLSKKYAKSLDDHEELAKDKKVREIQMLTLIVGVIVAFACRANLFKIYDPTYVLNWFEVDWCAYKPIMAISDFFGCMLTGVFLSLGSKFFHDLLGILMETKNLKRKLKDRDGVSNLHTIEEVDKYIAEVEPLVIEKQVSEYLSTLTFVESYEFSEIDSAVDVFLGEVTDDELKSLKPVLNVRMANKKFKAIELNYFTF